MQAEWIADLIEKASEEAGSQRELAARIGVAPSQVTDYKLGIRECPPEKVALIAHEAKLPADQWLTRAVLWRQEGKPDAERLKKALGKCLRATTVVAVWGFGIAASSLVEIPRCIEVLNWRRFFSRKIQSTCSRCTTWIGRLQPTSQPR